jgi:hypothetical protein
VLNLLALRKDEAQGVAQMVECLPCKYKALSSNPSTTTKRKTKEKKG